MAESARAAGRYSFSCIGCCVSMLIMSGGLLTVAIVFVRKVALRQATGQPDIFTPKAKPNSKEDSPRLQESRIRRVSSSPVLWKELRGSVFGKRKLLFMICIGISLLILAFTYIGLAAENDLKFNDVHATFAIIFYSIGFLFTAILPSTAITHEKESRSWHLLLTTTLSDWEIVFGKFIGSVKRCLPAWGYLFIHLILFMLCGFIHPLGVLQVSIITLGTFIFLIGSGLFFSTMFKRTTTAVMMNLIFAAVIWGALPFLIAAIYEIGRAREIKHVAEGYVDAIPFAQIVWSMNATANGYDKLKTVYWARGKTTSDQATMIILISAAVYIVMGFLFAWLAKRRFRKKIF
jgi:ABC-type transport system involved in multi-copper enzyme maturation permease subunit